MYQVDKNTVSLLHFDDSFKDETGKVWTANGSSAISSVQSKFGGKSLYLDGSSSYLTTPNSTDFNFGSGDFTIDWWEYRTASDLNRVIFGRNLTATSYGMTIGACNGTNIVYYLASTASSSDIANGVTMGTMILNAWTHYALVRSGTSIMAFQNGILKSTITSSLPILYDNSETQLGHMLSNNLHFFNGYIDEFRISNIARWTENFDPVPVKTNNLLRITLNDSSEREYQCSDDEITSFVTWCNRTIDTGTAYYVFDKIVGAQTSKEYLFFEKIISFEVIKI